jgi:hypothetical protein
LYLNETSLKLRRVRLAIGLREIKDVGKDLDDKRGDLPGRELITWRRAQECELKTEREE